MHKARERSGWGGQLVGDRDWGRGGWKPESRDRTCFISVGRHTVESGVQGGDKCGVLLNDLRSGSTPRQHVGSTTSRRHFLPPNRRVPLLGDDWRVPAHIVFWFCHLRASHSTDECCTFAANKVEKCNNQLQKGRSG